MYEPEMTSFAVDLGAFMAAQHTDVQSLRCEALVQSSSILLKTKGLSDGPTDWITIEKALLLMKGECLAKVSSFRDPPRNYG